MHPVVDSRPMTFSERDEIARYYECVVVVAFFPTIRVSKSDIKMTVVRVPNRATRI